MIDMRYYKYVNSNGYACECDQTRMVNLSQELGMPTIFIRYNPDSYIVDNKAKKTSDNKRLSKLKEWLDYCLSEDYKVESYLSALYLYFDEFEDDNKPIIITPFEKSKSKGKEKVKETNETKETKKNKTQKHKKEYKEEY